MGRGEKEEKEEARAWLAGWLYRCWRLIPHAQFERKTVMASADRLPPIRERTLPLQLCVSRYVASRSKKKKAKLSFSWILQPASVERYYSRHGFRALRGLQSAARKDVERNRRH